MSNSAGTAVNFASSTAITFTNGQATVSGSSNGVMKLYQAGPASIVVSDGTINNNAAPLSVTVGLASTASLSLSAATTTPTAGAADNLTITALDTYGNTATGYTGSKTLTFSGASAIGTHTPTITSTTGTAVNFGTSTAITFTNGQATVTGSSNGVMTLYKAGPASIVVSDGTLTNGTGLAVTVAPAPPNKLVYNPEPPATGASNTTLTSFGVSVEDTYGNLETTGNNGSTDTVTLSLATKPTNGAFSSPTNTYTNVAAVNGTATFASVALNNIAGSYTFTATDTESDDLGVSTATSTPATIIKNVTLVQQNSIAPAASVTSVAPTLTSGVTAGDALILVVADESDNSDIVSGVSGGGVTWAKATSTGTTANGDAEIWYGLNSSGTTGSTAITVTFSGSASHKTNVQIADVSEWSGVAATGALDQATNANNTIASISAGSVTPSVGGELIISDAYLLNGTSAQPTPTNSFTSLTQMPGQSGNYRGYGAYLVDGSTSSISTTWASPGGAGAWSAAIATFEP